MPPDKEVESQNTIITNNDKFLFITMMGLRIKKLQIKKIRTKLQRNQLRRKLKRKVNMYKKGTYEVVNRERK